MTHTSLKYKKNLWKRFFAGTIDYSLFLLFFYFYVDYMGHDNDNGGKTVNGFPALVIPFVWFLYFVILETIFSATPGHIAMNLEVQTLERKEIGFKQALRRHLLDIIDCFFYGIPAIIAIRNSDKHQRLDDMWAQTIVVDLSDPEQYYEDTNLG